MRIEISDTVRETFLGIGGVDEAGLISVINSPWASGTFFADQRVEVLYFAGRSPRVTGDVIYALGRHVGGSFVVDFAGRMPPAISEADGYHTVPVMIHAAMGYQDPDDDDPPRIGSTGPG